MGMHIVIVGNARMGFKTFGPFKTHEDAITWAQKHVILAGWEALPLYSPESYEP